MSILHHPFWFTLVLGTFGTSFYRFWINLVWRRITDEGSVPEMRILSILIINSYLNDVNILVEASQSDFPPVSWPWYRAWPSPIMSGFHGAFATGVAWQQGTLTLPDTWFRPPFWDLLMLQLLRPNSSNLPCLYSTFHLEHPLVLSRFCFLYFQLLGECLCWWTSESPSAHVAKFNGWLWLIRSVLKA